MNHTQVIQQLIKERNYKSFLEIGYGQGHNFNTIEVKEKVAVDPEVISGDPKVYRLTSDEYFDQLVHNKKFCIVFVDGSHLAEQVERDIVNAWKHLKKGGVILVHDIRPLNEQMTRVPRETREWCGTTYQAWAGLTEKYPTLNTVSIPDDYGIGIIEYTPDVKIEPPFVKNITFNEYQKLGIFDKHDK